MNLICGIGVIPWFLVYIYQLFISIIHINNIFFIFIPLLIFMNGILYHIIFHNKLLLYYDLLSNIIFIIYINYITKYNLTLYLTIISMLSYISNYYLWNSDYIHVVLVNWVLLYAYLFNID